jgi:integrase
LIERSRTMRNSGVIRYAGKRGVVWRIKYVDANGTQIQETLGREADGWTRKKAKAELRERIVRVEKKGYTKPSELTFGEFADAWLDQGKALGKWKPRTVTAYEGVVARLKGDLGSLPVATIKTDRLDDYVTWASETQGPASLNRDISILHGIFKAAKRKGFVESNPVEDAERPKITQRDWRILQPVEVGEVLKAFADDQPRTVFLTLILTGIRRHELQGLRWRDVELSNPDGPVMRIRDSKSERGIRSIAIPPVLSEALWQHRRTTAYQGEDEYVFTTSRGGRFSDKQFAAQFRKALKVAGIEDYVRPFHDLRHSAITNDAASGYNAVELMTKAGHSDMKTTKLYMHLAGVVFPERAEASAERLLGGKGSHQEAQGVAD